MNDIRDLINKVHSQGGPDRASMIKKLAALGYETNYLELATNEELRQMLSNATKPTSESTVKPSDLTGRDAPEEPLSVNTFINLTPHYQNYEHLVGRVLNLRPNGRVDILIVAADLKPGKKGPVSRGSKITLNRHYLKNAQTFLPEGPAEVIRLAQFAAGGGIPGGQSPADILGEQDVVENLRDWFKEKWVRFGPDGKIRGACARGDDSEGKPKCLPQAKAHALGKKGRASAAARKRREDPNPERSGAAINVNTKKKSNEGVAEALDPDTQRLEQEVRDALANGDDYTAKSLVKMAQTPADRNYLRKIIRQEMYGTGPGQGGVAEGKVKLYTDPGYFGAEVDDAGFDSLPVVNISADRLVGFEPDSKMQQPKSQANVEKIVAGLKKGDKLPPLLVRKYKNGYQVLDGHHRFWAYKLSGTKSIPVRIVADKEIEEISKQGVAEGSLKELAPSPGFGGGNYFQELASAWYNGLYDTGNIENSIKSQEDVERLLERGIVCPDGVTRKFHIDYNANYDGVVIFSDDYYRYGGDDETIDSRTGKKWGPYDFMEFSGDELDESVDPGVAEGEVIKGRFGQKFVPTLGRTVKTSKYEHNPDIEVPVYDPVKKRVWHAGVSDPRDQQPFDQFETSESKIGVTTHIIGITKDGQRVQVSTTSSPDLAQALVDAYNRGGFTDLPIERVPFPLDEKQDACYRKVKSRYKVWPSAYASGALVQCRKKGAANWGNKVKESSTKTGDLQVEHRFDEPLSGWHIVYRKSGNPVLNTPSFETKEQAQKYLMTKMFKNHQDFHVAHTAGVREDVTKAAPTTTAYILRGADAEPGRLQQIAQAYGYDPVEIQGNEIKWKPSTGAPVTVGNIQGNQATLNYRMTDQGSQLPGILKKLGTTAPAPAKAPATAASKVPATAPAMESMGPENKHTYILYIRDQAVSEYESIRDAQRELVHLLTKFPSQKANFSIKKKTCRVDDIKDQPMLESALDPNACPHCAGSVYSNRYLAEKMNACYRKGKSLFSFSKINESVECRKKTLR